MTPASDSRGYHTLTPYLIVRNGAAAIEFYRRAFGAAEVMRMSAPGDRIGHAEMKIGDSPFMLADEHPEMKILGPQTLGGTAMTLLLYVDDVDAQFARAVAAGAKSLRPVQDQFYGDRTGTLEDPFGHQWTLATHIEDLSLEELNRRHQELLKQPRNKAS